MDALADSIAPRGWRDGVLKGLLFLGLVNGLNWVLTVLVRGLPYGLTTHLLDATVVATPFTALIMALLWRERRLRGQLTTLATTDLLTGLSNRRDFLARTRTATEGAKAGALLVLDADHFKRINDTLGHAAGDACLQAIAQHLRASLRPQDIVGRVGGEEFAVFLPGAAQEEAEAVGTRLCRAIAVQAAGVEERLRVTLSAGAAVGERGMPLDRLMARADEALYEAKAAGRARLVIWPGAAGRSRAA
jgi:diguanylate cyclase (GGDEF)-like protein